jgi:hypothetical protein
MKIFNTLKQIHAPIYFYILPGITIFRSRLTKQYVLYLHWLFFIVLIELFKDDNLSGVE